jgi:hypothetical protein
MARSACATSRCPAWVSRTRRPRRSISGSPASDSSKAICCDTAEGEMRKASATAAMVWRRESSRRVRSRAMSIPDYAIFLMYQEILIKWTWSCPRS